MSEQPLHHKEQTFPRRRGFGVEVLINGRTVYLDLTPLTLEEIFKAMSLLKNKR
jgi:hypothetical protein